MSNLEKYRGIIPAFYACYDENGNVSPEGVRNPVSYTHLIHWLRNICQREPAV